MTTENKAISNKLFLAYYDNDNKIVINDLEIFKPLKKFESNYDELVTYMRHFKDINHNRDIFVPISSQVCNVKIWELKDLNLVCIKNISNLYNNGYINGACFFLYNSIIYLSVINCENDNKGDNIKLDNIENQEIFILSNTAQPAYQVEAYNNNKNLIIIVCSSKSIKSYTFNFLSLSLYKEYIDEEISGHINMVLFVEDDFKTKIIHADNNGTIRIWDFNSNDLIYKIKNNNKCNCISLYNNYLIIKELNGPMQIYDLKFFKIVNCKIPLIGIFYYYFSF